MFQCLVQRVLLVHCKPCAFGTGVCVVHLSALSAWPWDVGNAQLFCDGSVLENGSQYQQLGFQRYLPDNKSELMEHRIGRQMADVKAMATDASFRGSINSFFLYVAILCFPVRAHSAWWHAWCLSFLEVPS